MKIKCKLATGNIIVVEVSPNDQLNILLTILNIKNKAIKFIFDGMVYSMASILTFQEIGLTHDARIALINQAIAGGGGGDMNRFANLSDEFLRKDDVAHNDPNIPKWRTIGKGIKSHIMIQIFLNGEL